MSKDKPSFSDQFKKLESIVEWFESEDIDLDKAIPKFDEGVKLVNELKKQLESAQNKINLIKSKHKGQ